MQHTLGDGLPSFVSCIADGIGIASPSDVCNQQRLMYIICRRNNRKRLTTALIGFADKKLPVIEYWPAGEIRSFRIPLHTERLVHRAV